MSSNRVVVHICHVETIDFIEIIVGKKIYRNVRCFKHGIQGGGTIDVF